MIRFSSSFLYSAFLLVQTEEFNIVFSLFPLIVFKIMLLVILSMRTHQCPSILIPGTEQTLWCWLCGCTWLVSTDITTFPLASSVPWCCKKKNNKKKKSFCFWIFLVCPHWQLEHFLQGATEHNKHCHRSFFLKTSYLSGYFLFSFSFCYLK